MNTSDTGPYVPRWLKRLNTDRKKLAYLFFLAVTLRMTLFPYFRCLPPVGDEEYYWRLAADPFSTLHIRPPLWVFLLSLPRLLSADPLAGRLLGVALGGVYVVLIFLLTRRLFREKTAWTAALMAALYPQLVAWSHYLWAEISMSCLMMAGCYLYFRNGSDTERPRDVAASAVFGLAFLAKEFALIGFLAAQADMIYRFRARALKTVLLSTGAFAVPFLLWVGYFSVASGHLANPYQAAVGNSRIAAGLSFYPERGEAALPARELIHPREGHGAARRVDRNLTQLWGSQSLLRDRLFRGDYGPHWSGMKTVVLFVSMGAQAILFLAGFLGLIMDPRPAFRRFSLLTLFFFTLTAIPMFIVARFRASFLFILIIGAARLLSDHEEELAKKGLTRHQVLLAVAVLAMVTYLFTRSVTPLFQLL